MRPEGRRGLRAHVVVLEGDAEVLPGLRRSKGLEGEWTEEQGERGDERGRAKKGMEIKDGYRFLDQ